MGPQVTLGAGVGTGSRARVVVADRRRTDLEASKNGFVGPNWSARYRPTLLCSPLPLPHAPCAFVPHLCRPAIACTALHQLQDGTDLGHKNVRSSFWALAYLPTPAADTVMLLLHDLLFGQCVQPAAKQLSRCMMTCMPAYVLVNLLDDTARRRCQHALAQPTCNWLHALSK